MSSHADVVTSIRDQAEQVREFLIERSEASFATWVDDTYRKALLLACASSFESVLSNIVRDRFEKSFDIQNHPLAHFAICKGIKRQYHTWFDWDSGNANRFLALFGPDFKSYVSEQIKSDTSGLDAAIADFMELGRLRNQLVHDDFGSFQMPKTIEEIYSLFSSANVFVDRFRLMLDEFCTK